VARQVDRDHPVVNREGGDLRCPHVQRGAQ
jgi:hypothetical protein